MQSLHDFYTPNPKNFIGKLLITTVARFWFFFVLQRIFQALSTFQSRVKDTRVSLRFLLLDLILLRHAVVT